jgi:hypothetical protein
VEVLRIATSDAKGMPHQEEKSTSAGCTPSSSRYLDYDQDVIVALEAAHRQMTIAIKTAHVRGYQEDKEKGFDQLTIPEKCMSAQ